MKYSIGDSMPLYPGKKNFKRNIVELVHAGHEQRQAIAIAYDVLKKKRKKKKKQGD